MKQQAHKDYLLQAMKNRGWAKKDVARASSVWSDSHLQKDDFHIFFDRTIFWMQVLLFAALNTGLFVMMIPILFLFSLVSTLTIIILLGMTIGILYAVFAKNIAHMFYLHQNYIAFALLPAYTLAVGYIIFSNNVPVTMSGASTQPLLLSCVYTIAFASAVFYLLHTAGKDTGN